MMVMKLLANLKMDVKIVSNSISILKICAKYRKH